MSTRIEEDEEAMAAVRTLDRLGYSISDVEMAWITLDLEEVPAGGSEETLE